MVYSKMMKRSRTIYAAAAFFALSAVFAVMSVGLDYKEKAAPGEAEIVLRYGDVNPEGNITVQSARYFADQVNELSKGRIEIDIYSSGILGDELQSYQQLQMGGLDFYRANGGSLDEIADAKVCLLALPYIFRDREHFWEVCGGPIGQELLDDLQSSGSQMVGVFYIDEGIRNLFMVDEPVTKLEDMKGKTIRVMVSDTLSDTIRAFGARPVVSTYAELYNTLQTGEVDGADNPVSSYYSNKFYQLAPYYIRTGHMYSPSVVVMSEITWDHLSENDREIIRQAAEKTELYNQAEIRKAEENSYSQLAGVTILEPEDPEKWEAAVEPVYEKYGKGNEDLIRRIRETGLK